MQRRITIALAVVALAAISVVSLAGTFLHYTCKNPKCGLRGDLLVGPTLSRGKVTGYCTHCSRFVSLTWDFKQEKDRPHPAGTVWVPATGLNADLYNCPMCTNVFLEIDELAWLERRTVFCPSCTNLSLRVERKGHYD